MEQEIKMDQVCTIKGVEILESQLPPVEAGKLRLKGTMESWLKHDDGSVEYFRKDNLIVDAGFDFICDAMFKPSGRPNVMSHIAIGTGTHDLVDALPDSHRFFP